MICSDCHTPYEQGQSCPKCYPEKARKPDPDRYLWLPIALGVLLSFVVMVPTGGFTRGIKDVLMASIPDAVARLVLGSLVCYFAVKIDDSKVLGKDHRKMFSYLFVSAMLSIARLSYLWNASSLKP